MWENGCEGGLRGVRKEEAAQDEEEERGDILGI
jgi:hypothetical protein